MLRHAGTDPKKAWGDTREEVRVMSLSPANQTEVVIYLIIAMATVKGRRSGGRRAKRRQGSGEMI